MITSDMTKNNPFILMVDDDKDLCQLVQDYLIKFELTVDFITDSQNTMRQLAKKSYSAMIVDVMMPAIDGFELVRLVRSNAYQMPIIMLTARGEVADKVVGLENGADDYLSKPFEPRELVARIFALTRRRTATREAVNLNFQDIRIHPAQHRVEVLTDDTWQAVMLTDAEFRALMILVNARPNVVSRDELSAQMRGLSFDVADRSLDITISRLRAKLNDSTKQPRFIKTYRYSGYAFIGINSIPQ